MLISQIQPEDFNIIPQNVEPQDLEIWINETLIDLELCQPVLYKYLTAVMNEFGEQAALVGIITFKAVENVIGRAQP